MLYDLTFEDHVTKVTPRGDFTLNDVKTLIEQVFSDPRFNSKNFIIIDLTQLKYIPVVSEIVSITDYVVDFKQYFKSRNALIIEKEPLHSLCKLAAMLTTSRGLRTKVFKSIADATEWFNEED